MKLYKEIKKVLIARGWTLKRKGSHEIWEFTNKAIYALSSSSHSYDKAVKDIEKLEKSGPLALRIGMGMK